MNILPNYEDDRAALDAAITVVESEPEDQVANIDFTLYGDTFVRLFSQARDELDASERKAGLPLDGDALYQSVLDLARDILSAAHEHQGDAP